MKLVEDILKEFTFGFRLAWINNDGASASVQAYEVVATTPEGDKKYFYKKEYKNSMDLVEDIEEAEPYLRAMIKWDGCSHVWIEENHLCGKDSFKAHIALMKHIYDRAFEVMGVEDGQNEGIEW